MPTHTTEVSYECSPTQVIISFKTKYFSAFSPCNWIVQFSSMNFVDVISWVLEGDSSMLTRGTRSWPHGYSTGLPK